jgi:hypothetical protein
VFVVVLQEFVFAVHRGAEYGTRAGGTGGGGGGR